MPLVEQQMPHLHEKAAYFDPDMRDYRAVISQIKQEILVEISGQANGSLAALSNVPDAKLKSLLNQMRLEAQRRGLLEDYDSGTRPRAAMSVSQTLLAVLLFPAARRKLERILAQTALGGLELLEKTKDNIALMMEDELF